MKRTHWDETNNLEDTEILPVSLADLRDGAIPRYYDISGNLIGLWTWARLADNMAYKRVARTWLQGKRKWVSTIWLGLDHRFEFGGPPVIFESMVFSADGAWIEPGLIFKERHKSMPDLDQRRYSTLEDARTGHNQLVRWWRLNRKQRRKITHAKEGNRDKRRATCVR